jgi:hypothetical protein
MYIYFLLVQSVGEDEIYATKFSAYEDQYIICDVNVCMRYRHDSSPTNRSR